MTVHPPTNQPTPAGTWLWSLKTRDAHDWSNETRNAVIDWLNTNGIEGPRVSTADPIVIEAGDNGPVLHLWLTRADEQGREIVCQGCRCCAERAEHRAPLLVHPPDLDGREEVYQTFDAPDGWRVFRVDPEPRYGRASLLKLRPKTTETAAEATR